MNKAELNAKIIERAEWGTRKYFNGLALGVVVGVVTTAAFFLVCRLVGA